ncbi:DUF1414 domain-containing protein [Pseudidiomarina insulisalsae]|uniref:Uncharacterized protein n=1 Tax=Pseudidiomarina insulisalsae TaxID=575789 RepID=A0A432YH31_9GAMM|nr:DUF1414 domain-containing protein [Pseudidiomarina insulisalsae]RUO60253.1 hypothetical protein CWI71_07530 [Pseudidiomarina insulisalsae]
MPIVSKYDADRQEKLVNDVLSVLHEEQVPVDLALMTLGNAVTHILSEHYAPERAHQVAEQFGKVLLQSLNKSA